MIREANLTVDGLKIIGQLHLPEKRKLPFPAVILCHGIPSGSVDPTDGGYPLLAETICRAGFAVYTFRFRGSGESQGNFDITGWTRDLEAAIGYIWGLNEADDGRISLVGFSAGAAVAVCVAANDKRVSAVAACACPSDFNSIVDSGKPQTTVSYFRKIGIIRDPDFPSALEDWLGHFSRVNALKCVAEIAPRPLLVLHARQDNVVPVSNAEMMYEQAGEPKQKIILEGSEHRLRRNAEAVAVLIRWLQTAL